MNFFHKDTILNSFLPIVRERWLSANDTFPPYLTEVPQADKNKNEAYAKEISAQFHRQITGYPRLPFGKRKWNKKTYKLLYQVLSEETVLGLHHYLSRERIEVFVSETKEFIKTLRMDVPAMSFEDMGQALRNYIVYLMFKEIHQDTSLFSKACYGYSMLYPFTDNYIDNTACTKEEKARYNSLIRDFLKGESVNTTSWYDEKTLYFLSAAKDDCIEGEPCPVTELLLLMLDAQVESLSQQRTDILLDYEKRLAISMYKGGMSVLIDRYFVKEKITREDMVFYLGFGFFLQLADDLQDIKEDSMKDHQTLFTISPRCEEAEKTVNKLLSFITDLCRSFPAGNKPFLEFVLMNCYQLILMGVQKSQEYFPKDYMKSIEKYFPVSFSFLAQMPENPFGSSQPETEKLQKIMDTMLM
ncbi:hypothetical protein [Anaerocolumna xylanovorans]|uniref:Uncharacterized protein n=1 Tax=Anaerocolumna xylanovorans DSM 12503 TaxID=1121345 RepID=A0A1M7XWY2_9FIRM|nr:hypothetical protein [Anaerocolumna xylanovorans]SHO43332.1 hypothetical protein SAMN02745217_00189 [Anaerocolumna xylanovorans DSM 12503]